MLLHGRLVCLRAIESDDDVETWRSWINRPDVMDGMDRAVIATPQGHRRYVGESQAAGRAEFFGIDALDGGRLVGVIWLWDVDRRHRRAEVRIVIGDSAARGRGYGADAVDVLARHAFVALGMRKLYAYVHAANAASLRAFERAGFCVEATLEREAYRDGRETDVYRLRRFANEMHD
ncbi:MAG: GNAT family protein [Candidatus Elarobacter sp.]